jgi:hypothetical protein
MPKLYHHQSAWQIPGQQDRKATRVDVPNAPAALAAWLNSRRVPLEGDAFDGLVPGNAPARELLEELRTGDGGEPWILGAPAKDPPRYDPKFSADVAGGAEFVPVTKAAEIDRLLERCPKCHGTWTARVLAGIPDAELADLEAIADKIREVCAVRNLELADQAGEARQ